MFFHSLSTCRVNSYIIAKKKKAVKCQKDFVIAWIEALNNRAAFMEQQVTRRAAASFMSPQGKHGTSSKRSRMSNTTPTLPEYRLEGSPEEHIAVVTNDQKRCTYGAFLYAKAKLDAPTLSRKLRGLLGSV
jgi:hypothetical protein